MADKQTSNRVSKIAASLTTFRADDLNPIRYTEEERNILAAKIRSVAASALGQDETKGDRK